MRRDPGSLSHPNYRPLRWAFETAPETPIEVAYDCPAGDLNGDGVISAPDLAILLGAWGQPGSADFNESGLVDVADLALLLGSWGVCI